MRGYKAFNHDLTCKGMQYEIGKEYTFDGDPIPCKQGFHFCESIADCYRFYPMADDTRICEIRANGKIATDDGIKYCTNKIRIVREIDNPRINTNVSTSSSGYCNTGHNNSGYWNTGDHNSRSCNSGNYNSGSYNAGYCNDGYWNTGDYNTGDYNTGRRNVGDYNTGRMNGGHRNSGDFNSGNCNTGENNSGVRNTGDWNSGDWNNGVFNTCRKTKIKMFDADSNWTFGDWRSSKAYHIMNRCPCTYSVFIDEEHMTSEEKEQHPEYKTICGYVKKEIVTYSDRQKWWDELPDEDKRVIYALPNFSKEKFEECVGIEIKDYCNKG